MSEKNGYVTLTYKVRLYNRHQNWLLDTRKLYNQVVWHYYQILQNNDSLLEQSTFFLLRKLEEGSVGTKEMRARGEEPIWQLKNLPKIPLYFRRAAINAAIGLARSAFKPLVSVDCSPVFYKGMYREFREDSIQLKLYNGEKWVWVTYPYTGRPIPKEGKRLSPTLKVEKKDTYLHIPVTFVVADNRTIREQMKEKMQICAVAFPDRDCLAVCALLGQNGEFLESCFIRGGKTREAQRRKVLERLEKSKESRRILERVAEIQEIEKDRKNRENAILYQRLERINQYYAHKVSREILEYCRNHQIKVIVVPNYEHTISFRNYSYLYTNGFRWQGRAIIRNLKYKAYKEGIFVTMVRPYHISDCCSECGAVIQRYNEGHKASKNYYGGQLFFCLNGHHGNAALNSAKNIGRYFLKHDKKSLEQEIKSGAEYG